MTSMSKCQEIKEITFLKSQVTIKQRKRQLTATKTAGREFQSKNKKALLRLKLQLQFEKKEANSEYSNTSPFEQNKSTLMHYFSITDASDEQRRHATTVAKTLPDVPNTGLKRP